MPQNRKNLNGRSLRQLGICWRRKIACWEIPWKRWIHLQESINLLSSDETSKVMEENLPSILSVKYFSFFLFDKYRRKLRLLSHNHLELQEGLTLYQSESPIMKDAMTLGRYIFEQDFASSRYIRDSKNPLFKHTLFISIPLMIENEIIGVLNINDNEKGFFNL